MTQLSRQAIILGQRRMELGLTQQQLAVEVGLTPSQYKRFEYGERDITKANVKLVLRICAALELDPYELVFENGLDMAGVEK